MTLHHHHVFQFDENDQPIYFDGALIHDHDEVAHWDASLYHETHKPFDGYIDDGDCQDQDSGFECPWLETFA